MDLPHALRWGLITVIAGGLLALGAAACGDDDDDDDDDGDAELTAEEYFAQADAIDGDLVAFFETDEGFANAAEYHDAFLPELNTYEDAFNELDPPDDVQEAHDNYVDANSAWIDAVEEAGADFTEEDPREAYAAVFDLEENAAVVAAACELVQIAEEKGITLEFLECVE
jgi:hypothetical protein